jgi:hypothetical protein
MVLSENNKEEDKNDSLTDSDESIDANSVPA